MSEASIVLTAADKTKDAFNSVRGNVDSVKAAVSGLQGAVVGLGATMGALAFANIVKGAIDGAASLKQLSEQTGSSVEGLSKLVSVGKLSETSADSIGGAMNRLAKNMASVTEDGKGAAAALRAIGVDFATFQKMAPDQKIVTLSKALDGFNDGSAKSAVAMALMGKEGAKLLPFMKDLAEAGELQAKVTTAQAEQADELQKNLVKIRGSTEGWKKELAMGMTPALNEASQAVLMMMNGTGGLRSEVKRLSADGSIAEWTRDAIKGVSYVVDAFDGVKRAVEVVGITIGALVASNVQAFTALGASFARARVFDFSGAIDEAKKGAAQQKAIWSGLASDVGKILDAPLRGAQFRQAMDSLKGVASEAKKVKAELRFTAGDGNGDAQKDPFADVLRQVSDRTAAYKAEIENQAKLTEGQKLEVAIREKITSGLLKLTPLQERQLALKLQDMLLSEKLKDLAEARRKADADAGKAHEDRIRDLVSGTTKLRDEIEAQLEHNTAVLSGKEASAELNAAKLEDKAISLELLAIRRYEKDLDYGVYQLYLDQASALRDLAKAKVQGGALEDSVKNFKSVFESVDRTGHDVFNSLFTKGESTFKKLRDTAKATLLDVMYQLTAKPWLINLVANVTGTPLAAAQTAAGISGGGSAIGALGSVGAALGTFGGGLSAGFGGLTGSIGGLFGVAGSGATLGGAVSAGTTALAAGNIMGGLGTLVGALGPIAIGIGVLAAAIGKKGETRHGGQFSGTDLIAAPSGGNYQSALPAISGTMQSINALLAQLGSSDRLSNFYSGFEDSKNGKGFAYARGTLSSGASFGDFTREGYMQNRGSMTQEESVAAYSLELKRSTVAALQAANIQGAFGDMIRGIGDVTSAASDTIDAALARINKAMTEKASLDEQEFQLTASALAKVTHTREQERAALDATNRAQYDRIQALKDEQARTERLTAVSNSASALVRRFVPAEQVNSVIASQIADKLRAVGIPATIELVMNATKAQFASLYQQLAAVGNLDGMEALVSVADDFLTLRDSLEQVSDSSTTAADNLASIQSALMDLGHGISDYIRELRTGRAGTAAPWTLVENTRSNYLSDLSLARNNDQDALRRIQSSAQDYIEAQKGMTASGPQTQAVINQVLAELSGLPAVQSYQQQNITLLTGVLDAVKALPQGLAALLAERFDKLDTDLSGGLSFAEMQQALAGKATDAQIQQLLNVLDKNDDGQLSKLELVAGNTGSSSVSLDALLRRIGTDSLLAYSASTAGTVFAGIWANTGETARLLAAISGQMGATAVAADSAAHAASSTYTPPPATMPPVVTAPAGGSGWTPGSTTTETGGTTAPTLSLYQQAQASGLSYYVWAERNGYSYDTARAYLQSTGLPLFDVGTSFINQTGPAIVHRGERIVTAKDNELLSPLLERVETAIAQLTSVTAEAGRRSVNAQERTAGNTDALAQAARSSQLAPSRLRPHD